MVSPSTADLIWYHFNIFKPWCPYFKLSLCSSRHKCTAFQANCGKSQLSTSLRPQRPNIVRFKLLVAEQRRLGIPCRITREINTILSLPFDEEKFWGCTGVVFHRLYSCVDLAIMEEQLRGFALRCTITASPPINF